VSLPTRARIRAQTASVLVALAPFKGNVFNARNPPLRRDLLPAVRIYNDADTRTNQSTTQDIGWFDGDMTLTVQIIVEAGADPAVADRLDILCALAEQALMANNDWRKLAPIVNSIETTIDLDVQGELRTATAIMHMSLRYADCIDREFPDDLLSIALSLDFIDPPADPNLADTRPPDDPNNYPGGYPGPDGRIEVKAVFAFPTNTTWDDETTEWDNATTEWPT
jgi:hypothetical protein